MTTNLAELTDRDRNLLNDYETVIQQGLQSFFEVGMALMKIRDAKLYRETHQNFGGYCKERWGLEKAYAHRLIKGAVISESVAHGRQLLPKLTSERQARELSRLPDDQQAEAWQEAVETAPQGKVTAAHLQQVVANRLPQQEPAEIDIFDETEFAHISFEDEEVYRDTTLDINQVLSVIHTVVQAELDAVDEYQRMAIADYLEKMARQIRELSKIKIS